VEIPGQFSVKINSHAMVGFQPRIAYPNGPILWGIDHSLGIGWATSSSSNAHLAMPMSPLSWSARAAIPFSSRIRADTRARSWTRSSELFRLYRHSRVKASHLIVVPSLQGSGLWKKGSVHTGDFATQVRLGKKGQSRTPTSAFDATCLAPQIWQLFRNATSSISRTISMISRANVSDTGRQVRCLSRICRKAADPLSSKAGMMHLG
jgi:hypothetical protein